MARVSRSLANHRFEEAGTVEAEDDALEVGSVVLFTECCSARGGDWTAGAERMLLLVWVAGAVAGAGSARVVEEADRSVRGMVYAILGPGIVYVLDQ